MNINVRENIINNFKNINIDEIKSSIVSSIDSKDEIILPGLGVFFEILWNGSTEEGKNEILNIIKNNLTK